ncbi:MAG TPA: hypothetical protein VIJ79_07075 [Acidobacteriaceae bacterium]
MPPINGMVPFEDWKSRTALTFSRRSAGTLAVDAAYQEYLTLRSEKNAEKLYFIMEKYVREHGGLWSKSDRNIASGGLMEAVWKIAREHAHPGLGQVKLTDTDREAITFWKEQRELIAARFFKDCRLDVKNTYGTLKLPKVGETGVTKMEAVNTARNVVTAGEGLSMIHKLVNETVASSVDPGVQTEVIQFIMTSGMIPEMAAHIGTSLIPFKGVITAGGKALVNGIKAAVDVYRAYDMGTHQHVLADGTPQLAFQSMMQILDREKTKHLATAAQSLLQAGAAAVSQVFDPTHISQTVISGAFAFASLVQRIYQIGRDFFERSVANMLMATPADIGPTIVASHPILGCYLLIAADKSTLISFFGSFGNRGWMDEVELAIREHLTPLQDLAGTYIDDCRFELKRNEAPVYPLPGMWKTMKKWKAGRWETGGTDFGHVQSA